MAQYPGPTTPTIGAAPIEPFYKRIELVKGKDNILRRMYTRAALLAGAEQ